jgi:hypothetical protein
MAVALAEHLFAAKKFGDKGLAAQAARVSRARLSYAIAVLEYAPDLVEQVLHGASLDDAYAIAQERKAEQEADARALGIAARQ